MSFESLSTIFSNKQELVWQDEDVRFFVERYMGDLTKQGNLHCRVSGEGVVIRVGSALMFQEVSLWIHDLKGAIKAECDRNIEWVRIEV